MVTLTLAARPAPDARPSRHEPATYPMARMDSAEWAVGARSETGYVRTENQDRMSRGRASFGDIYVVSDGMGGHFGGSVAAELTVQILLDRLCAIDGDEVPPEAIEQAFQYTNRTIYERGHAGDPSTAGMGATVVVLFAAGARVRLAHVGDSRAYLFSRNGQLIRLTRDHTRIQQMLDAGMLSPAEAAQHPDASILERAMGQWPTVTVDISPWRELKPGELVLLCSDGLSGYVADGEIGAVLNDDRDPQALADELVHLALSKGGEDNVTVQVIRYGKASARRRWQWLRNQLLLVATMFVVSTATVFVIDEYVPRGPGARTEQSRAWQVRTDQAVDELKSRLEALSARVDALVPASVQPDPSSPSAAGAPAANEVRTTVTPDPPSARRQGEGNRAAPAARGTQP